MLKPQEIVINKFCDDLEFAEMFFTRRLPKPTAPETRDGFERILAHVGGLIYDFKLVPKFTCEPTRPQATTLIGTPNNF